MRTSRNPFPSPANKKRYIPSSSAQKPVCSGVLNTQKESLPQFPVSTSDSEDSQIPVKGEGDSFSSQTEGFEVSETLFQNLAALRTVKKRYKNFLIKKQYKEAFSLIALKYYHLLVSLHARLVQECGSELHNRIFSARIAKSPWAKQLESVVSFLEKHLKIFTKEEPSLFFNKHFPNLLAHLETFKNTYKVYLLNNPSGSSLDTLVQDVRRTVHVLEESSEDISPISALDSSLDSRPSSLDPVSHSSTAVPAPDNFLKQKNSSSQLSVQSSSPHLTLVDGALGSEASSSASSFAEDLKARGWEITGLLGEGGMARVYRLRHLSLNNKEAALKLPLEAIRENPEDLERFTREANIMFALSQGDLKVTGVQDLLPLQGGGLAMIFDIEHGPSFEFSNQSLEFHLSLTKKPKSPHLQQVILCFKTLQNKMIKKSDVSWFELATLLDFCIDPEAVQHLFAEKDLRFMQQVLKENSELDDDESFRHDELAELGISEFLQSVLLPKLTWASQLNSLTDGVFEGNQWMIADQYLRLVCGEVFPEKIYDQIFLEFFRDFCLSASKINKSGYIHRDHKPSNYILTSEIANEYLLLLESVSLSSRQKNLAISRLRYREKDEKIPKIQSRFQKEVHEAFQNLLETISLISEKIKIMDYGVCRSISELSLTGADHTGVRSPSELKHTRDMKDHPVGRVDHTGRLTLYGDLLGTPAFMSPRAIAGLDDPSIDLYAAGLTFIIQYLAHSSPFPILAKTLTSLMINLQAAGEKADKLRSSGNSLKTDFGNSGALGYLQSQFSYLVSAITHRGSSGDLTPSYLSLCDYSDEFFQIWTKKNPRVLRLFQLMTELTMKPVHIGTKRLSWDFVLAELDDLLKPAISRKTKRRIAFATFASVSMFGFLTLLISQSFPKKSLLPSAVLEQKRTLLIQKKFEKENQLKDQSLNKKELEIQKALLTLKGERKMKNEHFIDFQVNKMMILFDYAVDSWTYNGNFDQRYIDFLKYYSLNGLDSHSLKSIFSPLLLFRAQIRLRYQKIPELYQKDMKPVILSQKKYVFSLINSGKFDELCVFLRKIEFDKSLAPLQDDVEYLYYAIIIYTRSEWHNPRGRGYCLPTERINLDGMNNKEIFSYIGKWIYTLPVMKLIHEFWRRVADPNLSQSSVVFFHQGFKRIIRILFYATNTALNENSIKNQSMINPYYGSHRVLGYFLSEIVALYNKSKLRAAKYKKEVFRKQVFDLIHSSLEDKYNHDPRASK